MLYADWRSGVRGPAPETVGRVSAELLAACPEGGVPGVVLAFPATVSAAEVRRAVDELDEPLAAVWCEETPPEDAPLPAPVFIGPAGLRELARGALSTVSSPRAPLLRGGPGPGDRVGDYTLVRRLGSGGMGTVWEARPADGSPPVALKRMHRPAPAGRSALRNEFRVACDVHHPNLVVLHELHTDGDAWFITMELHQGVDVVSWVASAAGAAERAARATDVLRQLCEGLAALHQHGVAHYDLKPRNTVVTPDGRVVLLDFGIATAVAGGAPEGRRFAGTPGYMAPERWHGEPSGVAADVWSLGATLYELLVGAPPPATRLDAPLVVDRTDAPDAPPALLALVAELTDPDPARRPSPASLLARLLHHPMPAAPSARTLGRDESVRALREALLQPDGPRVVTLVGEPGVGRTRLMGALAEALPGEVRVVRFAGKQRDHTPFQLADALAAALHRGPRPALDYPALAAVLPSLGGGSRVRADIEAGPGAVGALVRDLARLLDAAGPVVLLVDDAQWADPDSAPLLGPALASRAGRLRVVASVPLLPSGRPWAALPAGADPRAPDEATPRAAADSPFLDELRRVVARHGEAAGWEERMVAPLSPEAALALADHVVPAGVADRAVAVRRVAEEGAGNPSFTLELAEALAHGEATSPAALVAGRVRELSHGLRSLLDAVILSVGPLSTELAVQVAGWGGDPRSAVHALRAARLVRTSGSGAGETLEPYHARVARARALAIDDAARVGLHGALADALLARGQVGRPLVEHLAGAGRRTEARGTALEAARLAGAALAWIESANLLRRALSLADGSPTGAIEAELAAALAAAGHVDEAADAWVRAAEAPDTTDADLARREATELLLASGRGTEARAVVAPLLVPAGAGFPSPPRALLGVLAGLLHLRLRGIGPRPGPPAPSHLARADLYVCLGRGLAVIDPLQAGAFSVRAVHAALDAGEPARLARALALLAVGVLAPAGGPLARWGRTLAGRAAALLDTLPAGEAGRHDPRFSPRALRATVEVCRGQMDLFDGRWADALARFDGVAGHLAAAGPALRWEEGILRMGRLRALEEMGAHAAVTAEAEAFVTEAERLGDRYAAATGRLYLGHARLLAGEPTAALHLADRALAAWDAGEWSVQHLYAERLRVLVELDAGRPARDRALAAVARARKAGLHRAPVMRIDLAVLTGRVALHALAEGDDAARRLALADLTAAARSLAREERPDAQAWAALFGGVAARAEGRPALARAAEAFAALGMGPAAAVASAWAEGHPIDPAAPPPPLRALARPHRWPAPYVGADHTR